MIARTLRVNNQYPKSQYNKQQYKQKRVASPEDLKKKKGGAIKSDGGKTKGSETSFEEVTEDSRVNL